MATSNYFEKLKDPRWQKKRLEVMSHDKFRCIHCGSTTRQLHVHHRYYVKHREPWDYPMFAFSTLCDTCHDAIHNPEEADDDEPNLSEVETALDWILSRENELFHFWDFAAQVAIASKNGLGMSDLTARLRDLNDAMESENPLSYRNTTRMENH